MKENDEEILRFKTVDLCLSVKMNVLLLVSIFEQLRNKTCVGANFMLVCNELVRRINTGK